jgi:hypothetical protein
MFVVLLAVHCKDAIELVVTCPSSVRVLHVSSGFFAAQGSITAYPSMQLSWTIMRLEMRLHAEALKRDFG